MKVVSYKIAPESKYISLVNLLIEVKPGGRTIKVANSHDDDPLIVSDRHLNFPWMYFSFDFEVIGQFIHYSGMSLYVSDMQFPNGMLSYVEFQYNMQGRENDLVYGNYICLGKTTVNRIEPKDNLKEELLTLIENKFETFFSTAFSSRSIIFHIRKDSKYEDTFSNCLTRVFYEDWEKDPNLVLELINSDKLFAENVSNQKTKKRFNDQFEYYPGLTWDDVARQIQEIMS